MLADLVTRHAFVARWSIAASLLVPALALFGQSRESTSCGSNIVSATVVATFCGHRQDDDEMLDLLILWRGNPGWFQPREAAAIGGGGGRTSQVGGTTRGRVYAYEHHGDVTISFDADFDADTVKIGDVVVPLKGVNAVLVDRVDEPDRRRIAATRSIEPRLPLMGDMNVEAVRHSRELVNYLRCDVPMPPPPAMRFPRPQTPIITVCEKLKAK